jgi:hypothetical protein
MGLDCTASILKCGVVEQMMQRENKPNQPHTTDGRLHGFTLEPTVREEVWGKSLTQRLVVAFNVNSRAYYLTYEYTIQLLKTC